MFCILKLYLHYIYRMQWIAANIYIKACVFLSNVACHNRNFILSLSKQTHDAHQFTNIPAKRSSII